MTEYNNSLTIRNKEIKFRKWKVKDKKKFIDAVNARNAELSDCIVFDCLEDKNVTLTTDEFKWVLMNIRAKSIGSNLKFDIDCEECDKFFEYDVPLLQVNVPTFEPFGVLKSGDITLEMGEVMSREYYHDAISQCGNNEEKSFIDMLYHVRKLNGSDAFTFDSLYEYINNMDLDVGEELFKQWNTMKFTFNTTHDVECPSCNETQKIQFDNLFGFFPDNWYSDVK
jgi:hypothetical protein